MAKLFKSESGKIVQFKNCVALVTDDGVMPFDGDIDELTEMNKNIVKLQFPSLIDTTYIAKLDYPITKAELAHYFKIPEPDKKSEAEIVDEAIEIILSNSSEPDIDEVAIEVNDVEPDKVSASPEKVISRMASGVFVPHYLDSLTTKDLKKSVVIATVIDL